MPSVFRVLDEWLQKRLRMNLKKGLSLGVPKDKAFKWGNTHEWFSDY
jgi:hypothetical protein